jgi:putative redox protein
MESQRVTVRIERVAEDETEIVLPDMGTMNEVLTAFIHCCTIYIYSQLKKLKQEPEDFSIEIRSKRREDGRPKTIHLCYLIKGLVTKGNAWRTCYFSIEKYCPLAETIRRTGAAITWEIKLIPAHR